MKRVLEQIWKILTKEQRNVISAPARADVLIAELCEFIIPIDKEEVSMEEREAV